MTGAPAGPGIRRQASWSSRWIAGFHPIDTEARASETRRVIGIGHPLSGRDMVGWLRRVRSCT
jgi:hypothetical protein